ncbi:hypothetical protein [Nocardia sp. NPDC050710]|uniref:hypothetical protein n=1 Tax=Nocardia sp. NPDC050710 TaxID=3157220 RepID=UPI0033D69E35
MLVASCSPVESSSAAVSFADAATIDPCGLITAEHLAANTAEDINVAFGATRLHGCNYYLSPASGREAGIRVDVHIDPDAAAAKPSGPTVITEQNGPLQRSGSWDAEEHEWVEVIHDQAGVGVTIHAAGSDRGFDYTTGVLAQGLDIATVGKRAASAVILALLDGKVPRVAYPADSLGAVDLCSKVPAEDITAALGRSDGIDHNSLGIRCDWTAGTGASQAVLAVDVEVINEFALRASGGAYGRPNSTVAGRPTSVMHSSISETGAAVCSHSTTGKTWDQWPGETNRSTAKPYRPVELLKVYVRRPGTPEVDTDQVCAAGQRIAEKLWPLIQP